MTEAELLASGYLTRDQVLKAIASDGKPISYATLRRWKRDGKIPKAVRCGFPAKALYSPETVQAARDCRDRIYDRQCPCCGRFGLKRNATSTA